MGTLWVALVDAFKRMYTHPQGRKFLYLSLSGLFLLAFFVFFQKLFLFLLGLILVALFSLIPLALGTHLVAIEFVSLPSLVFFYIYGWTEAAVFMIIGLAVYTYITQSPSLIRFIGMIVFPLMLVPFIPFKSLGIVTVGLLWAVCVHVFLWILTLAFGITSFRKRLIWSVTHMVWFWFLMTNFGEVALRIAEAIA